MTEYPLPESRSKAALIFLKNFAFGVRVFLFFCTYIGESVFDRSYRQIREGASNDMYDTARRVALVKQQMRENTRRRQRHEVISLSALCLLLFTALAKGADALIVQGQTAAQGTFGAMLLREDAGGYVLVAVVSFAAAAAITALCIRLRIRENRKKDGTDKANPQKQEERTT